MTDAVKADPLNQALAELINKAMSGVDAATSFLSAEIPDVVHQLLLWHGVMHGLTFLGSILLALSVYYGGKAYLEWGFTEVDHSYYHDNFDKNMGASMAGGFVLAVSVVVAVCMFNIKWLQILLAPKVYLLEYAASLVK